MRGSCLIAAVGALLPPTVVAAQGIAIDHKSVGCVVAGKFPTFVAHLSPVDAVSKARIDFHAEGDTRWYFVDMRLEKTSFVGVLPKPLKETRKIRYYIEATDRSFLASRTEEYDPIVAGAGECDKRGVVVAGVLASAKVAVGASTVGAATASAPLVPVGFSGAGVVTAGTAGTTAVGEAVGTSGGSHTGLILGAIGAAGAVAGGVVVASNGKKGSSGVSYSGPFNAQITVNEALTPGPGPSGAYTCMYRWALSGNMTLTLDQGNSVASGTGQTTLSGTVLGVTGTAALCNSHGNPEGPGFGYSTNPATQLCQIAGTPGNLTCNGTGGGRTFLFSGVLSGGVITGSVSYGFMVATFPTPSGGTEAVNGSTAWPVTLR